MIVEPPRLGSRGASDGRIDIRATPSDEDLVGQTIACANQKGGVGKTTTVVNLASYLALAGDRILVIDLDPQGNATSGLGFGRERDQSVYDALVDDVPLHDLTLDTAIDNLRLVPSAPALAGAEVELAGLDRREHRLADALSGLRTTYDYVFIDCPPSLGLLTVNALTASHGMLIPIQCEYYAMEGLSSLLATSELVQERLNPRLGIKGAVLTMYDGRTRLSTDVAREVRRHLGDRVYTTMIPRSVRLSEAPSHGLPIHAYASASPGARAYAALAAEVRARDGRPSGLDASAVPA
jgi:chromosome partitioning protein